MCDFIERRDGHRADPDNIFLTNGASEAVRMVMRTTIRGPSDGVMVPVPQVSCLLSGKGREGKERKGNGGGQLQIAVYPQSSVHGAGVWMSAFGLRSASFVCRMDGTVRCTAPAVARTPAHVLPAQPCTATLPCSKPTPSVLL